MALVPFATTLHLDDAMDSTILDWGDEDDFRLALHLVRYSLFCGADMGGYAQPFVKRLRKRVAQAPDREISRRIRTALDFLGERASTGASRQTRKRRN